MAVIQNECYRVVTIAYLKKFIKDGNTYLIKDSSGGDVDVNLNALSSEKRRDDYCPTYSELTGGSLIPTWKAGTTANGDRDGIIVSSSAILGGNYTTNQLVDQSDLSLEYTRFSGLTISATKTSFSECSGETSVSFTHKYIRRTKTMKNCPTTPEEITYNTASADTSDTACSELTWHTTYGSVTNCNTYKIPKNGSTSSNARTDSVYASIVFRGGTQNSNTLSMNQAALTGDYTYEISGSDSTVKKRLINITPTPSTQKVYGTNSNETCTVYSAVSLAGTGVYDLYRDFYWVDSCGEVYKDNAHKKTKLVTSDLTEPATSDSYTFNYSTGCCDTSSTQTKELTVRYGTSAESRTFSAICESCQCTHCECSIRPADCVSSSAHGSDNKKIVALYASSDCSGSWSWQHIGGSNIFYDLEFRNGYVYASNYANTSYSQRTETIRFTIDTCSTDVELCQNSATPPVSCSEIIVDGIRTTVPRTGTQSDRTESDSSLITNDARFVIKTWEADNISEDILINKQWTWDWMYDMLQYHPESVHTYPSSGSYYKDTGSTVGESGVLTVSHEYVGNSGTEADGFWAATQCVVARLEYMAHHAYEGDHFPTCLNHDCSFGCYPAGSRTKRDCDPGESSDRCCSPTGDCAGGIDYWYGSSQYGNNGRDPLLSYAKYVVGEYTGNKDRLVTVHWFRPGDEWDACPSALVAFLQKR